VKKLNKFFNIIILVFIVGYAIFYYAHKNNFLASEKPVQQIDLSSVDVDKVVNMYLKQTTEQMARERYDSKKALDSALKESIKINRSTEISPADIPYERQVHKDMSDTRSPSEVINAQIIEQDNYDKMEELNKKEYARQFIENARRGGYHVVLSDDLKVVSVTPIRKPSQEDVDTVESIPSN
jgi:hypothetical protein